MSSLWTDGWDHTASVRCLRPDTTAGRGGRCGVEGNICPKPFKEVFSCSASRGLYETWVGESDALSLMHFSCYSICDVTFASLMDYRWFVDSSFFCCAGGVDRGFSGAE